MFALILVFICVVAATAGQLTMKSGMSQVGEIGGWGQLFNFATLFHIFTNPFVLTGIVCYAFSAILWLAALSTLNVSFMYPLLSLSYVITAVAAYIFLKENVTLIHWRGIALVVAGCFLISSRA